MSDHVLLFSSFFPGAEVDAAPMAALLRSAAAIEEGRIVCRDIGGADPERMAAPKVADYVGAVFAKVSHLG